MFIRGRYDCQVTLFGDEPDLTLTVSASTPGDYNSDTQVNAADYVLWRDTFGSTSNLAANGNGNSSIDQGDYEVWRANFGTATGGNGASTGTAVPEPAGIILLGLAVIAISVCRSCFSHWALSQRRIRVGWLGSSLDGEPPAA